MKSKSKFIISLICVFVIGLFIGCTFLDSHNESTGKAIKKEKISNVDVKYYNGVKFYVIEDDYTGDYDYQEVSFSEYYNTDIAEEIVQTFNSTKLYDYYDYVEFCKEFNLFVKYTDTSKKYMIVSYATIGTFNVKARLANAIEEDGKITLYLWENVSGGTADIGAYFLVVPVDASVYQNEIVITFTDEEYNNIVKYGDIYGEYSGTVDKPIIYIYPEEEMNVTVKLLNSSLLTVSYPKYEDGWNVIAKKDGTLFDLNTNRSYYGLYYEGKNSLATVKNDGFVVEGKDTVDFLEEKLEILGLNEREINEFIVYWLPRLEGNKYNYIRFETLEEINNYMPMKISPEPDTFIRVIMDYKALDKKVDVEEQKLTKVVRKGYSVVEWGGSEIK